MDKTTFFLIITILLTLVCLGLVFLLIKYKKIINELNFSNNELENVNIEQRIRLENESQKVCESRLENSNLIQKIEHKIIENDALETEISELKSQISSLKTTLVEREKSQREQEENFIQAKKALGMEFENLANKIFKERSEEFSKESQNSLELILTPLKEQILNFQKRTNEIHDKTQENSTNLQNELKRILEVGINMSKEATNLTNALKGNNKVAGNWGEAQLEATLQSAGLIKDEHYFSQQSFKGDDGSRLVPDIIVRLPDKKHVIIDSKVSLLSYELAISSVSDENFSLALKDHVMSVKRHIDELSKKNYSCIYELESPDFVLMFMPIEPAYIEALKFDSELFGYGYERKVILVSHTTLMPILRTIANLWRIKQGNDEAMMIAQSAGEIYNGICMAAESLKKLGATLNTTTRHYNDVVVKLAGRQGVYGKVERFRQLSQKATQAMPEVLQLDVDIDSSRLENLIKSE